MNEMKMIKRSTRIVDTDLGDELLTVVHIEAPIKSATLGWTKKQESIPQYGRAPVKVGGHRLAAREDTARRHHRAALVAGRLLLLLRRRLLMDDVLTTVRSDQELAIVGAGRYLQMQWMLPSHSHVARTHRHARTHTSARTHAHVYSRRVTRRNPPGVPASCLLVHAIVELQWDTLNTLSTGYYESSIRHLYVQRARRVFSRDDFRLL